MSTDTNSAMRYMDHGDTGQEIPGQEDRTSWLNLPPVKRTKHRFTFFHPVGSWMHDQGFGWIPQLKRLAHYPGVNGVRRGPGGTANMKAALAALMDRGDLILSPTRFTVNGQDYCMRHRCVDGGWHYTDRWTSFVTVGGKTRTRSDKEGYREWVIALLALGSIDAMPLEVLEDKLAPERAKLRRLQMDARIGSVYVSNGIAEAEAALEGMRADWTRQFDSKPTRKTRSDKGKPRAGKTEVISES